MIQDVRKAAVLGAGTMGSRIAGHLANAGVDCLLLDIAAPGADSASARNAIVEKALKALPKSKPPALFTSGTIKRLTANAESLRAQVEAARALGEAAERQEGQMMEAVAALETLRVGLLRLKVGAVSLQGFTTDLDAVRQIGEKVDRLADAQREVDRNLALGRPTEG